MGGMAKGGAASGSFMYRRDTALPFHLYVCYPHFMKSLIPLVFLLSACTAGHDTGQLQPPHADHEFLEIIIYEIDGPTGYINNHIIETLLPDGTKCVIFYGGGITCDFQ